VIDYVKRLRKENPRDVVSVYIPEYVVGRWYEQLLHNQSALRLKGRLLYTPGVMVTSVPWQLASSELARKRLRKRAEWSAPGSVRRGPARPGGGRRGGGVPNGGGGATGGGNGPTGSGPSGSGGDSAGGNGPGGQ
jgi:hypothetical protein